MSDASTGIRRIEEESELEELARASHERPVWLFKHSLACGVSAGALAEYREFARSRRGADVVLALLEIQRARALSAAVAEHFGVVHRSPQVLLLRDGAVAWHASHWAITADELARAERLDAGGGAARTVFP